MRDLLQKVPFPVEFAVVLAGAFGVTIVGNVLALFHIQAGAGGAGLSELNLWRTVLFEAVVIAVLGALLWRRGWKLADFGFDTDWRDGLWAVALAGGSFLAAYAMAMLVAAILPASVPQGGGAVTPSLSPYVVAALVLVNAFYEEFFAAGYVITALKKKNLPNLAINLSVALRLGVHLFQGVTAVLLMVPIGLIFGTWYARSGRLWPLILGHMLFLAWSYSHLIKW
jgi:membrane protease YdiL (CAAX protease family)